MGSPQDMHEPHAGTTCLPPNPCAKGGREPSANHAGNLDTGTQEPQLLDDPGPAEGSARLSRGFATSPEISLQASL